MIGTARLLAVALCAALCSAPLAVLAEDGTTGSVEAEAADPIEILRIQVQGLLTSTRAELEEVEDLLFDDPDDPDLKAIAKDLRDSITQLEELEAQLPEPTLNIDTD